MCTLILAWRVFDGTPIAAAANRDEVLGRPSRLPAVIDTSPTVVAPQDEEAGGTWIGYNDDGLFVAITNRWTDVEGERSRGLLVRDALARESASEAIAFVERELAEREYAGFNLVIADAEEAQLLEWDGVLRTTHFDPGVHVVVNEGYNDEARKAVRIREAVHPAPEGVPAGDSESGSAGLSAGDSEGASASVPDPGDDWMDSSAWFERTKEVLADHDIGVCVHGDGYGTRSSSLIAIGAEGRGRYWFADDKPCETDYEEVVVDDSAVGESEADDQI